MYQNAPLQRKTLKNLRDPAPQWEGKFLTQPTPLWPTPIQESWTQ